MFSKKEVKKVSVAIEIIKEGEENTVKPNALYRYDSDPPNMLRIDQDYPSELSNTKRIIDEFECRVAGVSYHMESVTSFIAGTNHKILAIEQPQAKYPHAIAIYGDWIDIEGKHKIEQLGYVPDEDAQNISRIRKQEINTVVEVKLTKIFAPIRDELITGLQYNLAIFGPRIPLFCVEGYGRTSGRKRKKHYWAKNADEAIKLANADNMIVDVASVKEVQ